MFTFGFELEGFFEHDCEPAIPPTNYPTDGFPGLVELRTTGGAALDEAYAQIVRQRLAAPGCSFSRHVHTFSRQDKATLRRRHSEKSAWDIQNIYGKAPKYLGNKTIASCQLSISNQVSAGYVQPLSATETRLRPAVFGLFDIARVIRSLDAEFAAEIKAAGRQPGEYAIKDSRLEYRSLPNSIFPFELVEARKFLARIKDAVGEV